MPSRGTRRPLRTFAHHERFLFLRQTLRNLRGQVRLGKAVATATLGFLFLGYVSRNQVDSRQQQKTNRKSACNDLGVPLDPLQDRSPELRALCHPHRAGSLSRLLSQHSVWVCGFCMKGRGSTACLSVFGCKLQGLPSREVWVHFA